MADQQQALKKLQAREAMLEKQIQAQRSGPPAGPDKLSAKMMAYFQRELAKVKREIAELAGRRP